jgi:hypothetical protein
MFCFAVFAAASEDVALRKLERRRRDRPSAHDALRNCNGFARERGDWRACCAMNARAARATSPSRKTSAVGTSELRNLNLNAVESAVDQLLLEPREDKSPRGRLLESRRAAAK